MALESYRAGMDLLDEGLAIEAKADGEVSKRRQDKGYRKAKKRFHKASKKFVRALKHEPMLYQAHAGLGRALEKSGEPDRAMSAYDRALKLKPQHTEVMAWRAVTQLKLGRLPEVQSTYAVLARRDPSQAAFLRDEISQWQNSRDSGEGTTPDVANSAFDQWFAAQSQ
ncbi:MAG: tetratricopeptide repeat protein [Parvibaculaceae bacterium]